MRVPKDFTISKPGAVFAARRFGGWRTKEFTKKKLSKKMRRIFKPVLVYGIFMQNNYYLYLLCSGNLEKNIPSLSTNTQNNVEEQIGQENISQQIDE